MIYLRSEWLTLFESVSAPRNAFGGKSDMGGWRVRRTERVRSRRMFTR